MSCQKEVMVMDERLLLLRRWLREELALPVQRLSLASGDASFRRYFRVHLEKDTYIAMDAPPDREDCRPFVRVAAAFAGRGLNVPRILEADLERGLLLLSDFGDRQYLAALDEASAPRLYGDALAALLRLQAGGGDEEDAALPPYNEALLMQEMALFRDWFLELHLGVMLDAGQLEVLQAAFAKLAVVALEQPRVWVHRDYHSRNLMVLAKDNPGILDFQDAVLGPVTYDLVSLLRDCYIHWPSDRVQAWLAAYHRQAVARGLLDGVSLAQLGHWFDWMGVQRHLKAVGIFARLHHRDGKPGYLVDIPRTYGYLLEASARHAGLAELHALLKSLPLLAE
ncbi:MAG: aminoglycoside phosphotransferase family protein [Gammaproteobacteria bacterium]